MSLKRGYLITTAVILAVIVVIFFVQQGHVGVDGEKKGSIQESQQAGQQEQRFFPSIITQRLGSLCSGEEECITFCHDNKGRCTDYCNNNPSNELCGRVFPFGESARSGSTWCKDENVTFDYAPVNLEETAVFLPLGLMVGGHVTPIDHHYFQNFSNTEFDIEVYSPGKGVITEIQHMPGFPDGVDYRVVIQHSCSISSIYIHLGTFADKFKEYAPKGNTFVGTNIPVEAGELIGYYEKNVDYNIVDTGITLQGFVVPEHYMGEPWKIHVPNTYDYFNEPVKSRLIEKSVRTAEPITGKIDYDIDGKLVGNWFSEGTNGYAGDRTSPIEYWAGHLAIAYDAYDPDRIVFSIAGYAGKDSMQFAVKGNAPDPATVGVETGMVKYELVTYDFITPDGKSWDRFSLVKDLEIRSNDVVEGIVLAQLLEARKLKFEVFEGKTAAQVNGFTANAKIYER